MTNEGDFDVRSIRCKRRSSAEDGRSRRRRSRAREAQAQQAAPRSAIRVLCASVSALEASGATAWSERALRRGCDPLAELAGGCAEKGKARDQCLALAGA